MAGETFETIMRRNNTTLSAAPKAQSVSSTAAAAAPKTSGFGGTKKNAILVAAFALVLCFCLMSPAGAASIVKKRAIASLAENESTSPPKTCHSNTPCGWAIYIPFIRRIDYFMKNTCECSSDLACLKTDDDLSVNAYVYRCKIRPAELTSTEILPTTAI